MFTPPQSPLEFFERWVSALGWPAFLSAGAYLVWRGRGFLDHFKKETLKLDDIQATAHASADGVVKIIDNHLIHIEAALTAEEAFHTKQLELLNSIDKSLTVLVDRGNRI